MCQIFFFYLSLSVIAFFFLLLNNSVQPNKNKKIFRYEILLMINLSTKELNFMK